MNSLASAYTQEEAVRNLLILGAGGHGKVVKETALAMGLYHKIDFLDDNSSLAMDRCDAFSQDREAYTHSFPAFGDHGI